MKMYKICSPSSTDIVSLLTLSCLTDFADYEFDAISDLALNAVYELDEETTVTRIE